MSPEQKATKLFEIADELDRTRVMIETAELASEPIAAANMCNATGVLLSEIGKRLTV